MIIPEVVKEKQIVLAEIETKETRVIDITPDTMTLDVTLAVTLAGILDAMDEVEDVVEVEEDVVADQGEVLVLARRDEVCNSLFLGFM